MSYDRAVYLANNHHRRHVPGGCIGHWKYFVKNMFECTELSYEVLRV